MVTKNQNTTQTKISPIIFQPWKVAKILSWDWSKGNMQTRRLAGLERFNKRPDLWRLDDGMMEFDGGCRYVKLPVSKYGAAGDLLWVRETACYNIDIDGDADEFSGVCAYKADNLTANHKYCFSTFQGEFSGIAGHTGWRPSIFMPRWASRLTLEVVSTRIERLQEISHSDAIAEGMSTDATNVDTENIDPFEFQSIPVYYYAGIWDKINGKNVRYSWDKNPWVRVIEYKLAPLVSYETKAL